MHTELPCTANDPAVQFVQVELPETANDPAEQFVHLELPEMEKAPAEQFVHVAELFAPMAAENVPAGQFVHLEAPVPAAYVPAGQDVHDDWEVANVVLENVPTGHEMQVDAEEEELSQLPAGQEHEVSMMGVHATCTNGAGQVKHLKLPRSTKARLLPISPEASPLSS